MDTLTDQQLRHLLAQPAYRMLAKRFIDHARRSRITAEDMVAASVRAADAQLASMTVAQRAQLAAA